MKQLAWPSYEASRLSPERNRRMFSTMPSPSKCVTEPAFDAGRFDASPITKTFGAAFDWRGEGAPTCEVDRDLAPVVTHEAALLTVDLPRVELGDKMHGLLVEQVGQRGR